MDAKLEGIYVDLDALWDTRLGTVVRLHGEEKALELLNNGYHQRKSDQFAGVDMAAYVELYAKRDRETLEKSYVTGLIRAIREILLGLTKQAITRPYHDGTKLTVNVYPYEFSEEQRTVLIEVISSWIFDFSPTGIPHETKIVRMSRAELTPAHCLDNYATMFMYDYDEWGHVQMEALRRTPIPGVTLHAPDTYGTKIPTDEEIKEIAGETGFHPLKVFEASAKGFIDLDFLDVELFSLVGPS